jgi:hypothetical protein
MPRSRIASIQRVQAAEIGTWFRGWMKETALALRKGELNVGHTARRMKRGEIAKCDRVRNLLNDSTEFILSAAEGLRVNY